MKDATACVSQMFNVFRFFHIITSFINSIKMLRHFNIIHSILNWSLSETFYNKFINNGKTTIFGYFDYYTVGCFNANWCKSWVLLLPHLSAFWIQYCFFLYIFNISALPQIIQNIGGIISSRDIVKKPSFPIPSNVGNRNNNNLWN